VIIVSHDNRVFDFGDRIISMNDGRVEKVETGEEHIRGLAHPVRH
jgi:putative ABC transport system ATP-binding protein